MATGYEDNTPVQGIETDQVGLLLQPLTAEDGQNYFELKEQNRDRLAEYGDFRRLREATLEQVVEDIAHDAGHSYGIYHQKELIGNVSLTEVTPGTFVLGYWIDSRSTGHGFVGSACHALINYGHKHFGVTDIYAGVTKGNEASERVLARVGFTLTKDMGGYKRFHLGFPPEHS